MPKIVDLDEKVDIKTQLEENVRVVILVNKFVVKPTDRVQFLKVFEKTTKFMKTQPGLSQPNFIKALLEAIHSLSMLFANLQNFKKTFDNSEFQASMGELPSDTLMSHHLFKTVVMSYICVY
ncbi:hypothetical protein [Candidatus Nitrosocosmicus arcticus]|uniref:Putative enzyme involved in biosynthesis of extracellular polysaccharide n=1 Tax=Candidatus Nitrosocosmicus arcticus TaxID=2035267 RepID=A0A557SUX1_9ARCH|nr:hypothetical protein [Candidatus Nitrosocosmicus arcticus]TVP40396.1 putative enzyme involved in biosynthesis of extracellular polysaccharide [Candidatus Nitrosocosmicus arcticus]